MKTNNILFQSISIGVEIVPALSNRCRGGMCQCIDFHIFFIVEHTFKISIPKSKTVTYIFLFLVYLSESG